MKARRLARAALLTLALALTACGQNPESTEKARGVLEGTNTVLALSIAFIVVAGALVVGAVAVDRFFRSRRALAESPVEEQVEDEDEEEVVAGIRVGRAGVPRWLYGFYVLIPLFAMLYVLNNVALRPVAAERPQATEAPTGPVTEATIVASGIKFNLEQLTFPAETEVTVEFDNRDVGVPHDFTVWESEAAATANDASKKIANTNQITGVAKDAVTFETPAPGEYFFNCTVHPTAMFGPAEVVAV
jgi:plastocyanin